MLALVTGATGFLGRRLVEILVERGADVTILVRPGSDVAPFTAMPVRRVVGSLEDAPSLRPAVAEADYVFHCAARSGDWGSWDSFHAANVAGTANLLAATVEAGRARRFLHVSSTDIYGYPEIPCDERAQPRELRLPYHRSKLLAEREVQKCSVTSGLPTTIVRPVTIYGPRGKDWVVLLARMLLEKSMVILGDGHSRAGLVYVDDVVEGMLAAATSEKTIGQSYNLRHPADTTWREYLDCFADALGADRCRWRVPAGVAHAVGWLLEGIYRALSLSGRPLCTRHAVALFTRDQGYPIDSARDDFGYRPRLDLNEGLRCTLEWLHSPEGRAAVPEWGRRTASRANSPSAVLK